MTTDATWKRIQEDHEMAYFKDGLAVEFPESYSIDEMKTISDGMFESTVEVDAALRADFEALPPKAQDKMLDLLKAADPGNFDWWLEVLVGKTRDSVEDIS